MTKTVTWPCGCTMQSKQSTDDWLVLTLTRWCPNHRLITINVEKPEGWDKAKRKEN